MSKKATVVLPQTQEILNQMGEQIRLARLRRHLSAELVAERAGLSRVTLSNIEKGSPSVAIGSYAAVLHALNGMDKDLLLVARMTSLAESFKIWNCLQGAGPRRRENEYGKDNLCI